MSALASPFVENVLLQQSLSRYTAARLGGPADYLYIAKDPDYHDAIDILRQAWQLDMPVTIIGGGANVLVSDRGIRGLTVINHAAQIEYQDLGAAKRVSASSGTNLIRLVRYCQENGIGGMEWAIAVPGTVGGAVVNNAGAHGSDMASLLQSVQVCEADRGERWYSADELDYTYRRSVLKYRSDRKFMVLRAVFELHSEAPNAIQQRMDEYNAYRKRTQPPGASLGSIFKNPPGDFAGRLIEAANLKGYRIDGVQVSPIHANFFVNIGENASASAYLALIRHVRQRVIETFDIRLELEIQCLGEWG